MMTALEQIRQFAMFVVVGCAAAVGHYGLLVALVELAGAPAVPASAAGFVVGGVISYLLNYRFVFDSAGQHLPTAGKFVAVAVTGLALNSAIMWVLTHWAALHYLLAQVTATGTVMLWSYGANRFWTFGRPVRPDAPPA
ncbi:GtrA family protein [Azospirillum sp. TSO22-1]|uniref:GtrA family protein n=1 Tax=Azospirillum sp. TSO22-1 TaxID=716789 RepID=UPI000D656A3D|nr:GtrA family protein [Azospirillum sp. TSO22-1]